MPQPPSPPVLVEEEEEEERIRDHTWSVRSTAADATPNTAKRNIEQPAIPPIRGEEDDKRLPGRRMREEVKVVVGRFIIVVLLL